MGNYHGSGTFTLNGKFDGNMTIDNLLLKVRFLGKVTARSITVSGILKGDVEVDKIQIKQMVASMVNYFIGP